MKKGLYGLAVLAGAVLVAGGLLLLRSGAAADPLAYVMIGVGCGAFGGGLGELIQRRALRSTPEVERQLEIERKDERNRAIADRAKARAYDAMVFIFGAVMLSLALMEVDLAAVLLVVCAYLFVVGIGCYYRVRYEQEM